MPLANASTLRYSLRRNHGADQFLRFRLCYSSRLISRSPSAGLPYDILEETPSTPMADALFPLPLRELEDPLFCHAYLIELVSSLNLDSMSCNPIVQKITSLVTQWAAVDYDAKFQLVADIDYIQMFWMEKRPGSVGRGVMVEEKVVLKEAEVAAAEKQGIGGEECSVCYESYEAEKGGEREVAKIPCGHVFHKSCILTWFQRSNSCPLCRAKL
ncbi:NEP1-interacting protein-like 1 [Cucurbita maxima]|uniref:NEP1-interacting protein-like 1 n=1 Tax=Cucurbita maxima TaxID=3661 RepID=A0A6J1L186_CUCMA|nr:NEP1-interacting protein-like 1 [Cucurbita maxima]